LSAPLPTACLEVLRALAVGLDLRKIDEGWCFVGLWQDPSVSGIASETMLPLLADDYVREIGGRGEITAAGLHILANVERSMWERGLKWLRSPESQLKIS
jgi:hypothetical protein